MTFFSIILRDGAGVARKLGTLRFASLAEARDDVRAALPDTAADLIRCGQDPTGYHYLICDADDTLLLEMPVGLALPGRSEANAGA